MRPADGPRLGLALGGGAAHGVAHVGVLEVFEQAGIRPDLIVGTSAGALVGVLAAGGLSAARVAEWAHRMRWSMLARPVMCRSGLMSNDRLGRFVREALPHRTFEELPIPFACVATDVATFEPVLLRHGDLASAVRASCAMPGIIAPVERDGRLLIDGGVVDNVPAAVVRALGADVVIAVDVNRSYRRTAPPSNMFSIIAQSYFALGRAADRHVAEGADVLIAPDVGDIGLDELHRAAELIHAGEVAARAALPRIRALLEGTPTSPVELEPIREAA
ncbi:MAG TPA: patatin-like phospholipase family protein [Longimicrobiales bacterium]